MNDIENLLRHSIGLHAATIGSSVVEHTVRSRMRRLGLDNHEDYRSSCGNRRRNGTTSSRPWS